MSQQPLAHRTDQTGENCNMCGQAADMTGICLAQGILDFTVSLHFSLTYMFPSFWCLSPLSCALADLPLRPLTYHTTFLSIPTPNPCS